MYNFEGDKKSLYAIAALGQEAERFLNSHTGQAVIAKAGNETELLLNKFRKLKSTDIEGMQEVHFRISVIEKALGWLGEMIESGSASLQALEDDGEITNGP